MKINSWAAPGGCVKYTTLTPTDSCGGRAYNFGRLAKTRERRMGEKVEKTRITECSKSAFANR